MKKVQTKHSAAARETLQHYALRAHLALDEIGANRLSQKWVIEISCYAEIA